MSATTSPSAARAASVVARAATIIMVGNLLSRLLGFVRDSTQAAFFGESAQTSAYVTALTVQTSVYDLLISGVISAAFIPVFSRLRADEDDFATVAGTVLLVTGGIMTLAWVLIEIFTSQIIGLAMHNATAPANAAQYHVAMTALHWMSPTIICLGVAGVLTALLYAHQRTVFPAFSPAIFNLAIVLAAFLLHGRLGINSLVVGVVSGAVGQVALQAWGLRHVRIRWTVALWHPDVRQIGRLYLPVMLGLIVTQAQVLFDSNLQWATGTSSRAALYYATRLEQLPLGIVGTAMSLGSLPTLAIQTGLDFRRTLATGIKMIALLIVPATVGMFVLATPLVALAFQHHSFTAADTVRTASALRFYLFGAIAAAIDYLLVYAFYARNDTRTPVIIGLVSVGAYAVVALGTITPLGYRGLALADSAKQITHVVLCFWLLWRTYGALRGLGLASLALKIALAGAAMAGYCALCLTVGKGFEQGLLHLLVFLTVAGGGGVAVYLVILRMLGVSELANLGGVARARFRRVRAAV